MIPLQKKLQANIRQNLGHVEPCQPVSYGVKTRDVMSGGMVCGRTERFPR